MALLDDVTAQMRERIADLAPAVEEHARLSEALHKIDAGLRPASRSNGKRKRGRPLGSGKRPEQAVSLIETVPGATVAEIASAMMIRPNYLYRVLPQLEREGRIHRDGRGWYPGRKS